MKPDYHVVSFSGGKDSTAMLLHMMELGMHIDEVVCCDTYKEFPAMYRHIEKVKKIVEDAGIKFTHLRNQDSFDYLMFEHKVNVRNSSKNKIGYSWAGSGQRWCTSKLKTDPINRWLRYLRSQYNVIQYIGIAADEGCRLHRENNQKNDHRHPLVDWNWDEETCLKYCYDCGFDWEGLYTLFKRVSCWCCPLQSLEELRKLRKHFPELWEELKDMDKRTWRNFRADFSVEQLEIRFQFEEERLQQGLSITNRDFHNQLKQKFL
jgi:3'-phosphoadenosine 5'-phosphosulfate sulfotransferase (PAPS reductase)/FAD synthetase